MKEIITKKFEQAKSRITAEEEAQLMEVVKAINPAGGHLTSGQKVLVRRFLYTETNLGWCGTRLAGEIATNIVESLVNEIEPRVKKFWKPFAPIGRADFEIPIYSVDSYSDMFYDVYMAYEMLCKAKEMEFDYELSSSLAVNNARKKIRKAAQREVSFYWTHLTDEYLRQKKIF